MEQQQNLDNINNNVPPQTSSIQQQPVQQQQQPVVVSSSQQQQQNQPQQSQQQQQYQSQQQQQQPEFDLMTASSISSEWPTLKDGYQLEKKIGHGAFSTVWKAVVKCNKHQTCAIKIMDLENINSSFEDIRQEVQIMRLSDHPNVLRCYASFVNESQLWLVMQLMDKGSCLHVMNMAKKMGMGEGMREEWLAYILRETLKGLQYFHNNGQIHRDVKAGNILLDSEGNVRIADFGVSGWLLAFGNRRKNTKTFVGTPCWMAPEVMEQVNGYDYKADIWSFGITSLELAKGFAPYAHFPPIKVLLLTIHEEPPSLKSYADEKRNGESFSRGFREVIRLCLQKDPKNRPNCTTLLNHKLFKNRTSKTLVAELLNHIQGIGDGETDVQIQDRLPGTMPAYIAEGTTNGTDVNGSAGQNATGGGSSNNTNNNNNNNNNNNEETVKGVIPNNPFDQQQQLLHEQQKAHPKGTTWIFDDGSQVILKPEDETNNNMDDNDDFFDDFENNTGGENFNKIK